MPFHWCADETFMLLSALPFIGFFFAKLHAWWHKKFHHACHKEGCSSAHVEHCYMPDNIPHGKVGEAQCEQHPLTCDHGRTLQQSCEDCPNAGWPDSVELEEIGYRITTRGLVAGTILNYGPLTHEQVAELLPDEDKDELYTAINELVEEGRLVLDGELLTEGDLFG